MAMPVVRQICANCFGKLKIQNVEGCPLKEYQMNSFDYNEDLGIEVKRCSGCKVLSYCSKPCQTEHWHYSHKKLCKILSGKQAGPKVRHDVHNCLSCTEENQGARCKSLSSHEVILTHYWRYFDCEQGSGYQCPFVPGECSSKFLSWVDNFLYVITDVLQEAVSSAGPAYHRNPKAVKSYQLIRNNFLMLRSRYWCFCTQASGKNKQVADVKLAELAFTQMMKKTIYLGEEEREPRNPMLVLNNVFKGRSKSLIWEKFLHFTGKFYRMLRVMKYAIINLRNLPDKKKEKYAELININKDDLRVFDMELKADPQQIFTSLPDASKCFGCQRRFGGRKAQDQFQSQSCPWFCSKEEAGKIIHGRFPDKPIIYDSKLVSCGDRQDCIRAVVSAQLSRYDHVGRLLHEFLSHSLLCNGCIKYSNKTHKCSRCRAVVYCSQDCLNADWESHKAVCQAGAEIGCSTGLMDRRRLQRDLKLSHQQLATSIIMRLDPVLYTGIYWFSVKREYLAGLELD